jgi:hypothetical protein
MLRPIIFLCLIILSLLLTAPSLAQQEDTPPDYQVRLPGYQYSEDSEEIIVTFAVYNKAGPADREATAELVDLSTGTVIGSTTIRPLGGGGDLVGASIAFPVRTFPPDSNQALQIEVGIGEIEAEDSATILDNYAGISVIIPAYEPVEIAPETESPPVFDGTVITIPLLDVTIDLADPDQLIIIAAIAIVILALLLIILLMARILFRRSPAFGNWQPPYATMPPLDPNTTYGRRQLWQQHAQNNVVPLPCKLGSIHARKVLLGMDGRYLSGWRITAVRMTQYDMYGRVSRSQVLASAGAVRRLDRLMNKAADLDPQRLGRKVRPVARELAKRFRSKVNKRSAMLPIALDVRFQGTHGEVRILFELYECQQGQPQQLDYWEPEMTVLGKTIYESYTFTVYGQSGGESFRDFRKRLSEDLERVLVGMLRFPITTSTQSSPSAESLTSTQPVRRVDVRAESTDIEI